MQSISNIRKELQKLATGNKDYAKFHKKIANTKKSVIGIRTPDMRKFAKSLAKECIFAELKTYINNFNKESYDETVLAGFLINYAPFPAKQKITLTKSYLKHANSWAEIDLFAEKINDTDRALYWDFACSCLISKKEFVVRYGVVVLMCNFLTVENYRAVFKELHKISLDAYYVKMAIAWLYAEAALGFFTQTLSELKSRLKTGSLDKWTYKKALQKMRESRRFTETQQTKIAALRKL
jgi:hypothetical protein